jgi:hypothetical protein
VPSPACEDEIVHVTITRVSTGDQPISTATIVGEEMIRWLRDLEGFAGFLMLSRPGTTLSITFWESGELAERHEATRKEFRERISEVAGVTLEDVYDYEVTFAHLGALMTDG